MLFLLMQLPPLLSLKYFIKFLSIHTLIWNPCVHISAAALFLRREKQYERETCSLVDHVQFPGPYHNERDLS